jgi:hypothetical protein
MRLWTASAYLQIVTPTEESDYQPFRCLVQAPEATVVEMSSHGADESGVQDA